MFLLLELVEVLLCVRTNLLLAPSGQRVKDLLPVLAEGGDRIHEELMLCLRPPPVLQVLRVLGQELGVDLELDLFLEDAACRV